MYAPPCIPLSQRGLHLTSVRGLRPVYASLLKGQGHRGIFSLVKGTLWGNRKLLIEHFKGTKAITKAGASVKYQACGLLKHAWGLLDETEI